MSKSKIRFSNIITSLFFILCFLCIINCKSIIPQKNPEFNGKIFLSESKSKSNPKLGTKSTIAFVKDTIHIMHQITPYGEITLYRIGTFSFIRDSAKITCKIFKDIYISENTGSVVGYTESCNKNLTIKYKGDNLFLLDSQRFGLFRPEFIKEKIYKLNKNAKLESFWPFRKLYFNDKAYLRSCD